MFPESKVTEIYCMADDFCKEFTLQQEKYMIKDMKTMHRNKPNRMSDAEIMVILILFHSGGFRCFKHYYKEYVCKHLKHLFPRQVSYNRFVELEKEVLLPMTIFIKRVLLGTCTGISFVDSTPLCVCRNQRILIHKTFEGLAERGRCSMGWFFGFKVALAGQDASCTQPNRELLRKWREDWKLSDPLVELAATYARNTRQPMLYMDKLLSGWRDKDITTIAEAEEEHRRFAEAAAGERAKTPAPVKKVIEQQYSQRDYDPDEYGGMSQADIEEAKKL